jgi:hypothetical protein
MAWTSEAVCSRVSRLLALLYVRSFASAKIFRALGCSSLLGLSVATTTSADFLLRVSASPFQAQARSLRVRHLEFPCIATGSTSPCFGHWSFAFVSTLAPLSPASASSCSLARSFTTRFFQHSPRDSRLALRVGRCDLLPRGLSPSYSSVMPDTLTLAPLANWLSAHAGLTAIERACLRLKEGARFRPSSRRACA